ncbi:MAG: sulfurtransferase [Gemmatimonas sp.]
MTQLDHLARTAAVAIAVALLPVVVPCQGSPAPSTSTVTRSNMLVTTTWLAEHLRDPSLVILHVGRPAQYDAGHIPGARRVSLGDIATAPGPEKLTLEMPTAEQFTTWAQAQGIGDRSRVVIVAHDDTLQTATRVFVTLAYFGAMERVSLLDGGFKAWSAEGRETSVNLPATPPSVRFTARVQPGLLATLEQVEAATLDRRTSIIDARLPRFFDGNGGGFPRPGHIPTAVNIPLNTVSVGSGHLRAPAELRKLFVDAGVSDGKPVVTYCHIGQQASLLWFVATMLGYEARMFDGSFQQWSGTERLPVVLPPDK